MERGCAEFLARRFVQCSRFDPLYDAGSEQHLYDQLPQWLVLVGRQEQVTLAIQHQGRRFEAQLDSAELRRHVARLCEPLTQKLRSLVSPREPSVLQLQSRLADFPGVVESLSTLPGCTIVVLEPAAAARGALRMRPHAGGAAQGLRLTVTLPWDQEPDDVSAAATVAAAAAPTHVVFEGRAWRLESVPVQIGTELGESEYGIQLDGRSSAISRRHCRIAVEDGRVVVHDQSRYGTFLNGHRIEGSAVLQAGDVLRMGQPPREFALIIEVGHAA
jgi:hypothetical protein